MRAPVTVLFAIVIAGWLWMDARAQRGAPIVSGAHRFEKVVDGIYYATQSGTMTVGSNSPIIVTDTEALVVDSEITPAAARALVADLRAVTDKPVRYVVDSHYHYDHAHGNQIFGPEVQVIGHENTRTRMLGNVLEQYTYLTSVQPSRLDGLKQRLASETDPQQKAAVERLIANQVSYLEQVKETRVTPPNLTIDRKMTLFRGGREIQILYLGRGHTDTDVVVFLPNERIVATGDLMESVISYMGDSWPTDWVATLDRLKALDFDTVMPGHGVVFNGKAKIDAFQRYLRDVVTQTLELREKRLPADEAAKRIDVTAHSADFPQIRGVGIDPAGVRRIYELAEMRAPAAGSVKNAEVAKDAKERAKKTFLYKTSFASSASFAFLGADTPASVTAPLSSSRVPATGGDIVITPIIHSSVQIEHAGKVIQVDPWSLGNLSRAKPADLILVTDDPGHHLDLKAIQQLRKPAAPVVLTEAAKPKYPDGIIMVNGERASEGGITVEAVPAYDIIQGEPSHPKGKSNGYLVTLGGKRIYIAGVTECVPEVRALKQIDVAFIPLNIPLQRMTPAAAADCVKTIGAAVVYPYHYDQVAAARYTNPRANAEGPAGGLTVAQSLQAFKDALRGAPVEVRDANWYPPVTSTR